jgi:hypothetical protein
VSRIQYRSLRTPAFIALPHLIGGMFNDTVCGKAQLSHDMRVEGWAATSSAITRFPILKEHCDRYCAPVGYCAEPALAIRYQLKEKLPKLTSLNNTSASPVIPLFPRRAVSSHDPDYTLGTPEGPRLSRQSDILPPEWAHRTSCNPPMFHSVPFGPGIVQLRMRSCCWPEGRDLGFCTGVDAGEGAVFST